MGLDIFQFVLILWVYVCARDRFMKKFIGLLVLLGLVSVSALAKPILSEETIAKKVQKKLPQKVFLKLLFPARKK